MSEIKSLAAPKASFDRRAVVKGAAWSVPVIAAAIAAPAAAASHTGTVSVSIVPSTTNPTFAGTPAVVGTGPQGFTISTTGAAISGTASVSISIAPSNQAAIDAKKVGFFIGTINNTAVSSAGQWDGVVAMPGAGVASSTFTFGSYSRTGTGAAPNQGVTLEYSVTVSVAVIDSANNHRSTAKAVQATVTLKKPQ